MSEHRINIGIDDARVGFNRFKAAWEAAEAGSQPLPEVHLNFENLENLMSLLTTKRLELLRTLRREGPLSVRALATLLNRNYENIHSDTALLEDAELIQRDDEGMVLAPWDVIDAHVRLVA